MRHLFLFPLLSLLLMNCIGDPPEDEINTGGGAGSSQGGNSGSSGYGGAEQGGVGGAQGGGSGNTTAGAGQGGGGVGGAQGGSSGNTTAGAGQGGVGVGGAQGGSSGNTTAGAGQGGGGVGGAQGGSSGNTTAGAGQGGGAGKGGSDGECPKGLTSCSGSCVDTSRDKSNCGSCGNACNKLCIAGGCDEILEIKSGGSHTCARFSSGALRCWGSNASGQLGLGNTATVGDQARPREAAKLPGKVVSVGLKDYQTCAVLATGKLYCWGDGTYDQLGIGKGVVAIGDDEDPSEGLISLGEISATSVSPSRYFSCTVLADKNVRCWGRVSLGRLGNPALNSQTVGECLGDDELPNQTSYNAILGGAVKQVSVGACHACAVMESGTLQCWGCNTSGQLGRGNDQNVGDVKSPASVGPLDLGNRKAIKVVTFNDSTCVLLDQGEVRCWGKNDVGQLGYGNKADLGLTSDEVPAKIGAVHVSDSSEDTVVDIAAGYNHVCVLIQGGRVRCWGSGMFGKLGYPFPNDVGDNELPAIVGDVIVGGVVTQITVGDQFSCALLSKGNVRCWGSASTGKLGYPGKENIGDDETPDYAEYVF